MFCFQRTRRERVTLNLARTLLCICSTLSIASVRLTEVTAQNPAETRLNAAEKRKIETAFLSAVETSDSTESVLRELEVTHNLYALDVYALDVETAPIVEARVEEGDAAQLELNLLRAEVDRLRARRALVEGRLHASVMRLKQLVGMAPDEQLQLREVLMSPLLPDPPASLESALEIALRMRPDLRFARLSEDVARAGYRLAQAQAAPQVTAFVEYSNVLGTFDETPIGLRPVLMTALVASLGFIPMAIATSAGAERNARWRRWS